MNKHLYGLDCCQLEIPNLEEFNYLTQVYVEAHRRWSGINKMIKEAKEQRNNRVSELWKAEMSPEDDEVLTSIDAQIESLKTQKAIFDHVRQFDFAFNGFIKDEVNKKAYGAEHLSSLYEQTQSTVYEIRWGKAQ